MRSFVAFFRVSPVLKAVSALACITIGQSVHAQQIDPAKVVGRDTCKQCHSAEQTAWEHSSHNLKAWKLLDHPKAPEFAKALGIADIKGASACTTCHGTPRKQSGQLIIAQGNSCESCHGGAGGKNGWLETHYDFGLGRTVSSKTKLSDLLQDRSKETKEHRAARDAACRKAGMNRSGDAFEIARNCLQCHLVPNEKLVKAGHPMSTRFEFVEWAQGEVRHNFLLNSKVNAEVPTSWTDPLRVGNGRTSQGRKRLMVVVGQLADLEVSLRGRANVTSTKRGTLGDETNDRILDIQEELEEMEVPELQPVLAALANFDKKSLRKVTTDDKKIYNLAADAVAVGAKAFVQAHQGGDKLPKTIKIPSKAKGKAYEG
ncbi:MAG: hypothetical protein IH991_03100 [Planctomycetes bacterium]|nr:hypothetical protein [Planctomycetota bacterium]